LPPAFFLAPTFFLWMPAPVVAGLSILAHFFTPWFEGSKA
jgi:hypothetical protein